MIHILSTQKSLQVSSECFKSSTFFNLSTKAILAILAILDESWPSWPVRVQVDGTLDASTEVHRKDPGQDGGLVRHKGDLHGCATEVQGTKSGVGIWTDLGLGVMENTETMKDERNNGINKYCNIL